MTELPAETRAAETTPAETTAEKTPSGKSPTELKFAGSTPDWAARMALFLIFLYFGAAKVNSAPNSAWVEFFNDVGFGQWFRYFTGILEIIGAFLVLIPQTVREGLVLLMCIMSGALVIVLFDLHRPPGAIVPFALICAMIAFWMHRRRV